LIDLLNQPTSGFTTAGNASLPPYAAGKDSKLISALQVKPEEIADAKEKIREIEAELTQRRFDAERMGSFSLAEREDDGLKDILTNGELNLDERMT